MSAALHTPGPWWITDSGVRDRGGYICHTNPPQRYEGQDERFAQETAERAANKLLIAHSPDLLAELTKSVKTAEQSAFESWLVRARPSGNVEEVQDQWEHSSDFDDFCADWETQRAVIAKVTGAAS